MNALGTYSFRLNSPFAILQGGQETQSMKHEGNDPKRRIAKPDHFARSKLAYFTDAAHYEGRAYHKTKPADYGFHPPVSPRPKKSVCDDIRIIKKAEAEQLLISGFARGTVSTSCQGNLNLPKFVWAVDDDGEAYEAKLDGDGPNYHGYRINKCRDAGSRKMCKQVLKAWKRRSN